MRSQEALQRRIMELCDANDYTLNRLCTVCGLNRSTLSGIIDGRSNSVTITTVQKICVGLKMDIADFFDSDLFRGLEQEIR